MTNKSVSVLIVLLLTGATGADSQTGGSIEFYADDQMRSCAIVDNQPGIVFVHMYHVMTQPLVMASFFAPVPDCWTGVTWLGDTVFLFHMSNTQDSVYGLQVSYPVCTDSTIYIGYTSFYITGAGEECCKFKASPVSNSATNTIQAVGCDGVRHPVKSVGVTVNETDNCPCGAPDPGPRFTWGRLKAMFSPYGAMHTKHFEYR